jgi:hypothetical protein
MVSAWIVSNREVIAEPSFLEDESSPSVLQHFARGPETAFAEGLRWLKSRRYQISPTGLLDRNNLRTARHPTGSLRTGVVPLKKNARDLQDYRLNQDLNLLDFAVAIEKLLDGPKRRVV